MNALVYYLFVYPISKAPLWITYRIGDFFYLLLITIIPYRKKVITTNLKNSFPTLSSSEIGKLRRSFYWNFSTMMIEGIKNLSISSSDLKKRYRIVNPELMQSLYSENKSVLLVSGHYMNWEWMITGQAIFFPHQAVGIGMPLSSGFWDKKINELRSRNGMTIIHSKIVSESFEKFQQSATPTATLVLADQSPGDSSKSYWLNFLNQPTAVAFGTEQLANAYDLAVVFYLPKRIKRGYYEIELALITSEPRSLEWGELTQLHASLLEQRLMNEPSPWLWSHKRWKRTVPTNLKALKQEQREKFNRKYRINSDH
jgi:KDO2-lipid IV(A) lauroyltransferase